MAQQTAVEWLEQKIANKNPFVFMYIEELGVFEEAKQMEMEQILNAFEQGVYESTLTYINYTNCDKEAQEYYIKTYNNETTN